VRLYYYDAAGAELARDDSNGNFTITQAASVTMTAPNGGESWARGSTHNVTWTVSPALTTGSFRLLLYDATWAQVSQWVSPLIPAMGPTSYSRSWTITQPAGTSWRVRLYYYDAGGVELARDNSDANFAITP
jgi:hypothetical protein